MFPFGKKKANRRRPSKAGDTPRKPLFSRTNAAKNIDYDYSSASTFSDEPSVLRGTRSLDLSPAGYSTENSFRIGGSIDGEVEELYSRLGLSGPEGFAIDAAEWEASLKVRSALDSLRPSRFVNSDSLLVSEIPAAAAAAVVVEETRVVRDESEGRSRVTGLPDVTTSIPLSSVTYPLAELTSSNEEIRVKPVVHSVRSGGRWDGGIKGTRPPVLTPPSASLLSTPLISSMLAPPPSRALLIEDRTSSTWDIVKSMAPEDENEGGRRRSLDSEVSEEEEEEDEEEEGVEDGGGGDVLERSLILEETTDGAGSFSTTNDDDSSSTTTELVISPNLRFRKQIKSWMRGQLLGSGSFGTVYEGISDDGTFIAIKEVSLLDNGINGQQCILQLDQEIALLSQLEHENIVQYYGTSKEESKLVIFLELVTQGSLASLYQKYHLRDTQVSAYTKQILNGLNYLHERNVVHRDIKCANILVHANGSVKLADFGLAKEISKFSELKSCKGSVYWMAPEVVRPRKTYGSAADIWSLGCTVLELLTRQIPYPNVEWQHAFFKIGRGEQPPIPDHLSSEAQDFIRKCVQVDPNTRPTAAQLFDHPFITKRPLEAISR